MDELEALAECVYGREDCDADVCDKDELAECWYRNSCWYGEPAREVSSEAEADGVAVAETAGGWEVHCRVGF